MGKIIPFLFLFFLVVVSCENSIEVINTVTSNKVIPTSSAFDTETLLSDSGKLKVKLVAPQRDQYELPKKKYTEFPKGMVAYFYDSIENVSSRIISKYAIFHMSEDLFEARDSVVMNDNKGDTLTTEQLFWDRKRALIYSKIFTRIVTADGTFFGENGFESNQNFSKWKLINSKGTVKLAENPETE
jgi:LPS export ABC transporter protein LptC